MMRGLSEVSFRVTMVAEVGFAVRGALVGDPGLLELQKIYIQNVREEPLTLVRTGPN